MDISNANTEPFVGYYVFHENMNVALKILTASLNYTMSQVEDSLDDKALGNLIANTDPSWNHPPVWSYSSLTKDQAYGYVSELGFVSIFSALDDFMDGVEGEIARWNSNIDANQRLELDGECDESDDRVVAIYNKFGWSTESIAPLIPLLKYFRLVRNCIAHRSSKASPALCDIGSSQQLKELFREEFRNNAIDSLPDFSRNQKIVVDPKLAIFASSILRQISADVNRFLLLFLGEDGVLNMAAYHGFFKDNPTDTGTYKTPEAAFNAILWSRYRVRAFSDTEAISRASKLGLWKRCMERFSELQQSGSN